MLECDPHECTYAARLSWRIWFANWAALIALRWCRKQWFYHISYLRSISLQAVAHTKWNKQHNNLLKASKEKSTNLTRVPGISGWGIKFNLNKHRKVLDPGDRRGFWDEICSLFDSMYISTTKITQPWLLEHPKLAHKSIFQVTMHQFEVGSQLSLPIFRISAQNKDE